MADTLYGLGQEIRPYQPTWKDTLAGLLMGDDHASPERRNFVSGLLGSTGLGSTGMSANDLTPLGALLGLQEAAQHGDKTGMALNAVGLIPNGGMHAIFAGPMARVADKIALGKAQNMAAKGLDRDAIWKETGWFTGADGKWRFEIPDNKSLYRGYKQPTSHAELLQQGPPTVGQAFNHPALYDAYPELKDIRLAENKYGFGAAYAGKPGAGFEQITLNGDNKSSLALHELQHAIQEREGFAVGANPDFGWKRDEIEQRARQLYERPRVAPRNDPDWELLKELGYQPPDTNKPWEQLTQRQKLEWYDPARSNLYHSSAGEVEARNVQARMDMTPEQRRALPPWQTQDVPDAQQIIRFMTGN